MPDTEVQEGQTGFEFHIAELPLIHTIEEVEAALNASGGREIAIAVPLGLITEPQYLPVDPIQAVTLMGQIRSAFGKRNTLNGIKDPSWTILLPDGKLVITNGFHRYDVMSRLTKKDSDYYDPLFESVIPIRVERGTRLDVLRGRLEGAGNHSRIMPARFIRFISDKDSWPFSGISFDQALTIESYSRDDFEIMFPDVDYDDVNSVVKLIFLNLNRKPEEVTEYAEIAMHIAPELFDRIVRKHANFKDGEIPMSVARSFIRFLPGQFEAQIRLCEMFRRTQGCNVTVAVQMIRSYDLSRPKGAVFVEPVRRLTPPSVVHHQDEIGPGGGPRGSTEGLPDMIGATSVTSEHEVAGGVTVDLSKVNPRLLDRAEKIAGKGADEVVRETDARLGSKGKREIIERAMRFIDDAINHARDRIREYADQNLSSEAQRAVFCRLLDENIASHIAMHLMRRAVGDYTDQSRIVLREAFSQQSIDSVLGGIFEQINLTGLRGDDIGIYLRQKLSVITMTLEGEIHDVIDNFHGRCIAQSQIDVFKEVNLFGEHTAIMIIIYSIVKQYLDSRANLREGMATLKRSRGMEP